MLYCESKVKDIRFDNFNKTIYRGLSSDSNCVVERCVFVIQVFDVEIDNLDEA